MDNDLTSKYLRDIYGMSPEERKKLGKQFGEALTEMKKQNVSAAKALQERAEKIRKLYSGLKMKELHFENRVREFETQKSSYKVKAYIKGALIGAGLTGLVMALTGCAVPKNSDLNTKRGVAQYCDYSVPKDSLDPCAGCYRPEWYNPNDTWTLFNKPYNDNSQDYGKYNMDDGDCPKW